MSAPEESRESSDSDEFASAESETEVSYSCALSKYDRNVALLGGGQRF